MSKDRYPVAVVKATLRKQGEKRLGEDVDGKKPHEVRRAGVREIAGKTGYAVGGVAVGLGLLALAAHEAENSESGKYQRARYERAEAAPKQAEINRAVADVIAAQPEDQARMTIRGVGDNPNLSLKAARDQNGKMIVYPDPSPAVAPEAQQLPDDPNTHVK